MSDSKWTEITDDGEFSSLFVGATIVEANPYTPSGVPWIDADMCWLLSSGVRLAMKVEHDPGCPTCGYGGYEKRFWRLDP